MHLAVEEERVDDPHQCEEEEQVATERTAGDPLACIIMKKHVQRDVNGFPLKSYHQRSI